jgi:hypothetical protein
MASSSHRARARLRTTPLAIVTGLAAAVLMALTMTGTLSAFTASITNASTAATTGSLVMRHDGSSGQSCYSTGSKDTPISTTNTAACSTVSAFGTGLLAPDSTPSQSESSGTITVHNDGTVAARTFTLARSGACATGKTSTQGGGPSSGTASDLCGQITLDVLADEKSVWRGTLTQLGAESTVVTLPSVPAGESVKVTFTTKLADGLSNDYQGLTATVPLTWTFTA